MYKYSGYPQSGISFAEYIRANFGARYQVNKCIILKSLTIFLQVAKEEGLTPEEATTISTFKSIAYISPTGEAITA